MLKCFMNKDGMVVFTGLTKTKHKKLKKQQNYTAQDYNFGNNWITKIEISCGRTKACLRVWQAGQVHQCPP